MDKDFAEIARQETEERVFPAEVDGQRVWVKRACKNHANIFQRIFCNKAKMEKEITALRKVNDKGAITPEILHVGDDYFVLSDIGQTLHALMRKADPEKKEKIVEKAAVALSELHEKRGWHGNSALRNLTKSKEGIGFIDFENIASRFTPLVVTQVYDLWQLTHSAAYFDRKGRLAAAAIRSYKIRTVRNLLRVFSFLCLPLYILSKPIGLIGGRDIRQASITLQGIYLSVFL